MRVAKGIPTDSLSAGSRILVVDYFSTDELLTLIRVKFRLED